MERRDNRAVIKKRVVDRKPKSKTQRPQFTKPYSQRPQFIPQKPQDPFKNIMIKPDDISEQSSFSNLIGVGKIKAQIFKSIAIPNIRPDLYNTFTRPPQHIMLYGPPGTGKSELAAATAKEINATFYNVNKDKLTDLGGGDTMRQKGLQMLFEHAAEQTKKDGRPAIIFLDEGEALIGSRIETGQFDPDRGVKNELLTQMSGLLAVSHDIHILLATNYPSTIDGAFVDRALPIKVDLPDEFAREEMIIKWLGQMDRTLEPDFDLELIVMETEGYSGRRIKDILKLALDKRFEPMNLETINTEAELKKAIKSMKNLKDAPLTTSNVIDAIDENPSNIAESINQSIKLFEAKAGITTTEINH